MAILIGFLRFPFDVSLRCGFNEFPLANRRAYIEDMNTLSLVTVEDLLRRRFPNKRVELVDGRLIVCEPAGFRHGRVAARLAHILMAHVDANDLGIVCAAETGFVLRRGPDTVRAPDVAFISKQRLPEPEPVSFAEFAPDLAVEVLSPDDRPGEVLAKVADWLRSGSRLVWVVDPARQTVRVYADDGAEATLRGEARLEGGDVLPGFICEVKSLFRTPS